MQLPQSLTLSQSLGGVLPEQRLPLPLLPPRSATITKSVSIRWWQS
jgi:hypothetical protein